MSGLFDNDLPDIWTLARRQDAITSHEAAETVPLGLMMERAWALVRQMPGATAAELEAAYGVSDGRIRKRLNDLRKAGKVQIGTARRCQVTGRNAQTWRET